MSGGHQCLGVLTTCVTALAACSSADTGEGLASRAITGQEVFVETTATALPPQPCAATSGAGSPGGCYTNATVVADLDGDGNLDVVFVNGGNHFVPAAQPTPSVVYFGDGRGAFRDVGQSAFGGGLAPTRVRQPAVGDVDGDGNLDLYLPGGYGLDDDQLFVQREGRFVNEAALRLPPLPGAPEGSRRRSRAGGAHFGDLDGDGDLDLVVIDWGTRPNPDSPSNPPSAVTVELLVNDGTGRLSAGARLAAPGGSTATDVDLADVNGDFALDIVLNQRNGQNRLYLNDGAGVFADATAARAFPRKRGSYSFNGEACDIDGDGDLDVLFDGAASGVANHDTQVLVNDGTGRFTDETEARIPREPRTDDNQVKCADVDGDGDFDLVVASLANRSEKLLVNKDGRGHFEEAPALMPALKDPTLGIDFGDFDGDGRVDYVTAQGEVPSLPWLNRVFRNVAAAPDVHPPVLRAVQRAARRSGAGSVVHVALSDAHTSETGQAVRDVRLEWSTGGAGGVAPARFIGGDLFRAELPAAAGRTPSVVVRASDRRGNELVAGAVTLE